MSTPCATPTSFETLVALWSGDLSPEDAEAVETHLFSCDSCSEASDGLGRLVTGLREFVPPVISHRLRDRLAARGMRMRQTPVQSGVPAEARFTSDLDLLVHVLKGDLSRAQRVDVEVMDGQKTATFFHFQHVPFDPGTGEVLVACQRHFEHMAEPAGDPVFRVLAFEGGVRRQVGDYFVRHHWR
jgi:Putative zinc-finger